MTADRAARVTEAEALRNMLAAALRGGPFSDDPASCAAAEYHGLGPLILARSQAGGLMVQARARAMWELRHKHIVTRLLAAFDAAGVRALIIKGTALAYDLYDDAARRPRGDTDILVAPADLATARAVLAAQGFAPGLGEDAPEGFLQEVWQIVPPGGGAAHDIDLHWQAFNSVTLADLIPVDEAMAEAMPLPRLSPQALALSRGQSLLHACAHRAKHIHSPYFVGGEAHYGGDRLIWLCDIDRLARALTAAEWALLATRAEARGIAPVCVQAFDEAAQLLDTPLPGEVMARLRAASGGPLTQYLLGKGRMGRAVSDLRASGMRTWRPFLRTRLFPPAQVVLNQYPGSRLPVPVLYLRRMLRFLRGARQ